MIKVFGKTDTVFTSNGDVVLRPLKAKIHKEDNGEYYLALEVGLEYIDFIEHGRIVVANTPQGEQPFRIDSVNRNPSRITAKCPHVFFDSKGYFTESLDLSTAIMSYAVSQCNSAAAPTSPYTCTTSGGNVSHPFKNSRKSLYEGFMTIVNTWGAHLVRDGFNIAFNMEIGQDNGIVVQYKKNLKDISCDEDWSDVCTRLLPVGKDGFLLSDYGTPLPHGKYLSKSVDYATPYTKSVTFSQNINEADYSSHDAYIEALYYDLFEQGNKYLDEHYLPRVNYTLKANLDVTTDIGDTIEVIDSRFGVNMLTSVIAFDWDCILKKYTEVQFGNFTQKITGLGKTIASTADRQELGLIGNKQLQFNDDNTVSWIAVP